jgi:hypothetical protein
MSNTLVLPPYVPPRSRLRQFAVRATLYVTCTLLGLTYGLILVLFPLELVVYAVLPIGILGLLVIWALPDQSSEPRKRLFFFFFGFLLTYAIWPDYLGVRFAGLPVLSVRRLFSFPLAIVLLIAVSSSPQLRERMRLTLSSAPLVWKGLVLLVFLQFATFPMAAYKFQAVNSILNSVFFWTTIFFAAIYVLSWPDGRKRFVDFLLAATTFLLALSVVEYGMQARPWASIAPLVFVVDDGIGEAMLPIFRDGVYRVTSVFRVSLSYAEFLSLVGPFALHRAFQEVGLGRKLLWTALDLGIFIAAVATQARLGIVCFLVGHAAYGTIWAVRRWRFFNKADLIAPALVLGMIGGTAVLFTSMFTVDAVRVRTIGGGSSALSDQGRREQWSMAVPKIIANPFGYGPGQGGQTLGYVTQGGKLTIDSYALTILLEYGIVGFLTYVTMFGWAIMRLLRIALLQDDKSATFALPVVASLVVWLTSKAVLSQSENDPLAFMLLALAVCILASAAKEQAGPPVQS